MRKSAAIGVAALFFSAHAACAQAQQNLFSAIHADRGKFAGKTVVLHGVLNSCSYAHCSLCPDWDHVGAENCLSITSWTEDRSGGALMANLYRYSEIIVTASVRPYTAFGDLGGGLQADCFEPEEICNGFLEIAHVEKLVARRPSPSVKDADETNFAPMDAKTEAELRRVFEAAFPAYGLDFTLFSKDHVRIFLPDPNVGYFCDTEKDDFTQWPVKSADFLPNFANAYRCFEARRRNGASWMVTTVLPEGRDYGVPRGRTPATIRRILP